MASARASSSAAAAAQIQHHPHTGRPRWVHDVEAVVCAECHAPFNTVLLRRHHCRACGRVFCERCCHQRLLVPGDVMARPRQQPATALAPLDLDPRTPQRVCPGCAEELVEKQEELRRTVSRASQRLVIERRSLVDRYLNAPLAFDLESEIKKAAYTLLNFTGDAIIEGGRDAVPRELIWGAQGLAFLTLVKVGMFLSARVGSGLVIGRLPDGPRGGDEAGGTMLPRWSAPSAIACSGVGYGFQAGVELIDIMVVLNTPAALEAFTSATQVSVGTELSVSLGPLGRTAATDVHAGRRGVVGAAFAYGQSKGLFLGVSLEGAVLVSRPAVNRAFYGKAWSTHELLLGQAPPPRAAEPLYQALDEVLTPAGRSSSSSSTAAAATATARGRGGGLSAAAAEFAESTWHGYLARHTRHRRHHSRRRSAEAAVAAAAAAAAAAVEAATEAAATGDGPSSSGALLKHEEEAAASAEDVCRPCCPGDGEEEEDDDEKEEAEEQPSGTTTTTRTRRVAGSPLEAAEHAEWAAERARRRAESQQLAAGEGEGKGMFGGADPLQLNRRELRTFKTTAVFGPAKQAEAAAGRVGPGPGRKGEEEEEKGM